MSLSKQDIEHIANLARLELTDEELSRYGEQLSAVLEYIEQLKEVDTTGIEPIAQITGLTNALRADEALPWPDEGREAALREAPALEQGCIKAPRVLG